MVDTSKGIGKSISDGWESFRNWTDKNLHDKNGNFQFGKFFGGLLAVAFGLSLWDTARKHLGDIFGTIVSALLSAVGFALVSKFLGNDGKAETTPPPPRDEVPLGRYSAGFRPPPNVGHRGGWRGHDHSP